MASNEDGQQLLVELGVGNKTVDMAVDFSMNTIRFRLFKVAEKLVNTARQTYLKLSSSHVYQREFYTVFR